jgi:glycolate oxidase
MAPHLIVQDAVIPRTKLPEVLQAIHGIADAHGVIVCNVFHAGDGNLHPLILFDPRDPKQMKASHDASTEIMEYCIKVGGSITGEHGVGSEKKHFMPALFSEDDLQVMITLRNAYNPDSILNPQKVIPDLRFCREITGGLPKAKVEPVQGLPV